MSDCNNLQSLVDFMTRNIFKSSLMNKRKFYWTGIYVILQVSIRGSMQHSIYLIVFLNYGILEQRINSTPNPIEGSLALHSLRVLSLGAPRTTVSLVRRCFRPRPSILLPDVSPGPLTPVYAIFSTNFPHPHSVHLRTYIHYGRYTSFVSAL
jgi:hypothetical protein